MAVIFTEGNKRLEFSVVGYQFENRLNDYYDDNWLKIKIDYCDANRHATYTDFCVLVYELESVVKGIDDILSANRTAFISNFMEPFLQFAVTKVGDIFAVQVRYVYDSSTVEWKEVYIAQGMNSDELRVMQDGLKSYLTQFPYRKPTETKVVVSKAPATKVDPKDGIKFCSVEFNGSKPYYYITDDESIAVGDFVKVPTGVTNSVCVAEVVEVEYYKMGDAPMPLDKVKKIIGKVEQKN